MPLNQVQINHMNQTVRQGQVAVVRAWDALNILVTGLDAFAATPDKLPLTGPLDDGRDDAPALTGEEVVALRNIAANMRDQVSSVALDQIIGKLVHSYGTVIRG